MERGQSTSMHTVPRPTLSPKIYISETAIKPYLPTNISSSLSSLCSKCLKSAVFSLLRACWGVPQHVTVCLMGYILPKYPAQAKRCTLNGKKATARKPWGPCSTDRLIMYYRTALKFYVTWLQGKDRTFSKRQGENNHSRPSLYLKTVYVVSVVYFHASPKIYKKVSKW